MAAFVPRRVCAPKFVLLAACFAAAAWAQAAGDPAGRWEGVADIPGQPMRLVLDLARDAQGRWEGSATLPGRFVEGSPVDDLAVSGCAVKVGLASAFPGGDALKPGLVLNCQADGSLAGTFALGGRSAAVNLHRTGQAQVERPPGGGAISAALAGRWTGRYELGGYPREVTLTLANGAGGAGGGQLVIVGKRTTTLQVDQVVQGREFVTVRASAANFTIEGRFAAQDGVIDGAVAQGPYEAAIVLRRQPGEKSS
ncbi:MAG TPA: hypothetical protein VIP05_34830 [Burkholderiaceae bacterium]